MSDEQAAERFTALYRENYGRVLRFVSRRIRCEVEAQDLTAEVFRVAWQEASRGAALSPGWLFVTAQNTLRNRYRSLQRGDRLERALVDQLRSDISAQGAPELVHDALCRLRVSDREILMLRYWDELASRDLAEILNVSVSAVWIRLHRARRAFKEEFETISGG